MSDTAFAQSPTLPARQDDLLALEPSGISKPAALMALGLVAWLSMLAASWWALNTIVPDQAQFTLLHHTFHQAGIRARIFSNAALVLVLLPAALWIECASIGWQRSSLRKLLFARTPTVKTDIACFLLDQAHMLGLIGKVMMLGVGAISGMWLKDRIFAATGLALDPTALPMPLQVVLYFYAYSFFDYWAHRIGHHRLFWPLHRYHHSATEFTILNAERIHPAGFAQVFLIAMPMAALGATPQVLIYVNVVTIALGYLIHSDIESGWGWIGRYVIQSPLHHRLHHKLNMDTPTAHFSMTPVWDHLFGTWNEDAAPGIAIGVDAPYRQGYVVVIDLARDYWHFWRAVAGRPVLSASERNSL